MWPVLALPGSAAERPQLTPNVTGCLAPTAPNARLSRTWHSGY